MCMCILDAGDVRLDDALKEEYEDFSLITMGFRFGRRSEEASRRALNRHLAELQPGSLVLLERLMGIREAFSADLERSNDTALENLRSIFCTLRAQQ